MLLQRQGEMSEQRMNASESTDLLSLAIATVGWLSTLLLTEDPSVASAVQSGPTAPDGKLH